MKRICSFLLALVLVLSLTACAAGKKSPGEPVTFQVVVTDLDGSETAFEYTSDAASVGEALMAEGLITGDMGQYGLYITSVNGITADWDKDQTYWAFYINGEYAATGIEGTPIEADTVYSLILTKG